MHFETLIFARKVHDKRKLEISAHTNYKIPQGDVYIILTKYDIVDKINALWKSLAK